MQLSAFKGNVGLEDTYLSETHPPIQRGEILRKKERRKKNEKIRSLRTVEPTVHPHSAYLCATVVKLDLYAEKCS